MGLSQLAITLHKLGEVVRARELREQALGMHPGSTTATTLTWLGA